MMITTMFSTPLSSQIRDVCNDTWTITSLLLLGSVLSGLMPSLDPEPIVAALNARDVDYVVIGMFAANMADRELPPTYDIDFTPSATRENLDRLSDALRDLDARIRVDGMDEGLPFAHNGASLAGGGIWNLVCPHGEFDLSFIPSGTDGYPDLIQHAERRVIGAELVPIADLADVVRSKTAAGRAKDFAVLPLLADTLDHLSEHPPSYIRLRPLAAHLAENHGAYKPSPLLDEIRTGTVGALRTGDLVSVLSRHNIDPTGIFSADQVTALNRVAKAQGVELPQPPPSRER
jgi:hypothetical protein